MWLSLQLSISSSVGALSPVLHSMYYTAAEPRRIFSEIRRSLVQYVAKSGDGALSYSHPLAAGFSVRVFASNMAVAFYLAYPTSDETLKRFRRWAINARS